MDTITHIALGACTGEILLGRQLGKKALWWGIVAQNLPDIDVAAAPFVTADQSLLIHRGITHSLFFALLAGIILTLLAKRIHSKSALPFLTLLFFFCFQLTLHDLLDTCNSYGTGLLEPFIHQRFSINLLYVADPLFTIGILIASIFLIVKNSNNINRKNWAIAAVCISALYLCFSAGNKLYISNKVIGAFHCQKIQPLSYFTTPAPFNCMLWYAVAATNQKYYTAYSSVWDKRQQIIFQAHPKNYSMLGKAINHQVIDNLIEFAAGYYTVEQRDSIIYFNVLRFGQVQGWQGKPMPFAFSYPLFGANSQALILQKGRLAGWNAESFKAYLDRIAGKQTTFN